MKLKMTCLFDNYSVRNDGVYTLRLKASSSEMAEAIKAVMMIEKPLKGMVKCDEGKGVLDLINVKSFAVDRNGMIKLTLEGSVNDLNGFDPQVFIDKNVEAVIRTVGDEKDE